jgi:hypothetical protein
MKVLEHLPGNPIGINYRWIDDATVALMARAPSLCRVIGLRQGHEQHIEEITRWYREHGVKPMFATSLGRELTRLGYFQSGFDVSLIGEPTRAAVVHEPLTIEQDTVDNMEEFLHAAGREVVEKNQLLFNVSFRHWLNEPGWSLYLGRSNGEPAAVATLCLKDGVILPKT